MVSPLFTLAEEVEKYLGHLHNIGSHSEIRAARSIWLKAHGAFQTARCELRRNRTERFMYQLNTLATSSNELCKLAESTEEFTDVCRAARTAITALQDALHDDSRSNT